MAEGVSDPDREKAALRTIAKTRRRAAYKAAQGATPNALITNACRVLGTSGAIISAYLPIADEIDPMPIVEAMSPNGWRCCLPVVMAKDTPLTFRLWQTGAPLEAGDFRTRHPHPSADTVVPDVLLVPLLAFDRAGYRLGWGGGFYDRTLEKLRNEQRRIQAIGLAFAAQEVDAVPRDAYDQALDWVVTEQEAIRVTA